MANQKTRQPEPDDDDERDEAPVRKKKKKKKKQKETSRWPLIAGLAGGGVVVLVLLIFLMVKMFSAPAAVAPTAWEKLSVGEGNEFAFEHPADWKVSEKGIRNKRDVQITKGNIKVTIDEKLVGSLIANMVQAAQGGREVPDDQTPAARVHAMRRPQDASADYKEGPAVIVKTRGGSKAGRSEFTEGSLRGFRATILRHETVLDIYCTCRASDFDTLRPAFERIIESFGMPY
jgi:hypothetical protein